ncbi:outer membrane beta-barrel protein [Porphyromonas sp.]|uniref:outer membrane beta-barrel protein n=1 Tax=Porphyromonas sp. TaxID=1924944 RepID=UPI0026DC6E54|nr:outer membrane beta-barrel protein [Porphyromonas sp.]MDO4695194.1 outer membrane beta-barrel protein [Porphyromonas sp.]MDO4771006.1 outer membrane beta-barrel protein [Porphyromonas sp.]
MKNIVLLIMSCVVVNAFSTLYAQTIKGIVIDEQNAPLGFATFRVEMLRDSTLIKGGITDVDGKFSVSLEGIKLPVYIRVTSMGYETYVRKVETEQSMHIKMKPSVTVLNEAVVTAERPKHTVIPGGISTNVSGTMLSGMTDVMQVLKALPLVEVKEDEISVLSRGTPIVYVNGRKVRSNIELQRVQPHLIEKIEVLTNPDAKYDSSTGAVVLITVKREPGSGLSAVLRSDLEYYHLEEKEVNPRFLADLNYRLDEWDFLASMNYMDRRFVKESNGYLLGKVGDEMWRNNINTFHDSNHSNFSLSTGINYSTDRTGFGAKYEIVRVLKDRSILSNDLYSSINDKPEVWYYTLGTTDAHPHISHRPSAYFVRKVGDWNLSVDADYYSLYQRTDKLTLERVGEDGVINKYISEGEEDNKAFGVKVEASGALWSGQLSVGTEVLGTQRLDVYRPDPEMGLPDNDSRIRQSIVSGYATYSKALGVVGVLSAGLRLEHMKSKYFRGGKYVDELSREFTDLFPTFSFSSHFWGMNAQVSFNSRIVRPQYWQLAGEYTFISRFEYQRGEPNLLPSITYNTEVMLNRKWFTLYWSNKYLRRDILQYTERMPEIDKPGQYKPYSTLINIHNAEPYHVMQLMLIFAPKVGCWSPNLIVGGIMQSGLYFEDFDKRVHLNKPMLYTEMKNQFELPWELSLGINASMMAFGNVSSVKANRPSFSQNVSLTKQWLKGKWSLSLSLENFINIVEEDWLMTSRYTNLNINNDYKPKAGLSLRYRFNTTKSKYRGEGALDREIGRMGR